MGIRLGTISSIKDNIIYCSNNSSNSFIGERVNFYRNDSYSSNIVNTLNCEGCIFEASENNFKILLIQGDQQNLCIGDEIYGTSKTIRIKVGFSILGKTIDPFGKVLSKHVETENNSEEETFLENLFETDYRYISSSSPSIIERKKVSKPLLTGINSIDCLFPIGLGQRQLIIGDNNTGKTSLAISAILNQRNYNNNSKVRYNNYYKYTYFKPCIYVSIGQKRSEVIRIQKVLNNFESD
jgi:F-type H+-transporting ATPase subunit alpha